MVTNPQLEERHPPQDRNSIEETGTENGTL